MTYYKHFLKDMGGVIFMFFFFMRCQQIPGKDQKKQRLSTHSEFPILSVEAPSPFVPPEEVNL